MKKLLGLTLVAVSFCEALSAGDATVSDDMARRLKASVSKAFAEISSDEVDVATARGSLEALKELVRRKSRIADDTGLKNARTRFTSTLKQIFNEYELDRQAVSTIAKRDIYVSGSICLVAGIIECARFTACAPSLTEQCAALQNNTGATPAFCPWFPPVVAAVAGGNLGRAITRIIDMGTNTGLAVGITAAAWLGSAAQSALQPRIPLFVYSTTSVLTNGVLRKIPFVSKLLSAEVKPKTKYALVDYYGAVKPEKRDDFIELLAVLAFDNKWDGSNNVNLNCDAVKYLNELASRPAAQNATLANVVTGTVTR